MLLFKFFISDRAVSNEILKKILWTIKYSLEKKCERNFFVLWLFLAIVKFCMNCLDRVVLAHPFQTMATFPVCSLSLAIWQIEHLPCSLLLSLFTSVWEVGFHGTPIALRALQYVCWCFHYQPSFVCVVIPFLLPEKADTYFYNSSSFVVNWDISASTIHSHTHFMEQAFTKPYPSMECKCTTTKETERIIKSLKTKNSYGYDEISTKVLKISCPFISSPINYICNKMLFWGVFPDRLKYATIKPLHKSDDRSEVS